jgi:hypothetical protein
MPYLHLVPSEWRCPAFASTVSGAKSHDHKDIVLPGVSLLDFPPALSALNAFYRSNEEKAAQEIIDTVENGPSYQKTHRKGGEEGSEGEVSLHSRFFTALHKWWCCDVNASDITWFHEHRLFTTSQVDITAWKVHSTPITWYQPLVLVESVLESTTDFPKKRAQLQAEARNACHVVREEILPIFLGVLIDAAALKFEVHVYHGADVAKLADMLLVKGERNDLGRLLALLRCWCMNPPLTDRSHSLLMTPAHSISRLRINEQKGIVLKEYDYRHSVTGRDQVCPADRRQVMLNLNNLPEAKLVVDGPDVAVLQYKFIPGNHKASSGIQFLQILEQVSCLHKDNFVHGDIRESNIVFSGNDDATLIDFDLSRKAGQPYVSNFNVDIKDGKRHESAQRFQRMNYAHDYFALAEVMKLYESQDHTTNWQDVIRQTVEMKQGMDISDRDKWDTSISRIADIGGKEPRDTGSPKRVIDTLDTLNIIDEGVSTMSLADA